MVPALLHGAQIDRLGRLVGHLQAERIDVEGARPGEIRHRELDVAQPHDVERRIKVGFG